MSKQLTYQEMARRKAQSLSPTGKARKIKVEGYDCYLVIGTDTVVPYDNTQIFPMQRAEKKWSWKY